MQLPQPGKQTKLNLWLGGWGRGRGWYGPNCLHYVSTTVSSLCVAYTDSVPPLPSIVYPLLCSSYCSLYCILLIHANVCISVCILYSYSWRVRISMLRMEEEEESKDVCRCTFTMSLVGVCQNYTRFCGSWNSIEIVYRQSFKVPLSLFSFCKALTAINFSHSHQGHFFAVGPYRRQDLPLNEETPNKSFWRKIAYV